MLARPLRLPIRPRPHALLARLSPLLRTHGKLGLADNPNAFYVKAGPGVHPNGGRNTLPRRGIDNLDMSVSHRFSVGESQTVEFRVAVYSALSHPQYAPGSVSSVRAVSWSDTHDNRIPGHPVFD